MDNAFCPQTKGKLQSIGSFFIYFAVCNAGYFGTGSTSCTLCNGNMTKPEVGDSATCAQVWDPESSRPNDQRTQCGEYPINITGRNYISSWLRSGSDIH